MTQVSLYGDFPADLDFDLNQDHSDHDDDDDEDRKEEIKKALEAFGDEFDLDDSDYDDCGSSQNESRSSSVNQNRSDNNESRGNSILSNTDKDTSHNSGMNGGVLFKALMNGQGVHGNGDVSSPSPSNPYLNGVNLNMLPNSVMDTNSSPETRGYPSVRMNGGGSHVSAPMVNGYGHKLNGNGNLVNGNGNSGNSILKNSAPLPRPKKQVTIVEQGHPETVREQEEIVEGNPTISFHHKEHCPRMEKDGYVHDDIYQQAERSDEQLKTMLQIRERQIQQAEQETAKLQKDKRALNHQIGLMKTEMVQMRSRQEEFETYKIVKEQEVEFMKSKMRETIAEFEKAKESEIAATDHIKFLNDEIEKYRQEIQLLSSIGSSVQQVEINDVVRQLREKHAAELVSWKKQVLELQGQLRTYKRQQQLQTEESYSEAKAETETSEACCQTDAVPSASVSSLRNDHEQMIRKEMAQTQIAIIDGPNRDDLLIKEKKLISMNERFEELKGKFQEELEQKELEIREYRERLASLPGELYQRWEETQRELGLRAVLESRPICVDAFTSPMEPEEFALPPEPIQDEVATTNQLKLPNFFAEMHDAEVQADFPLPTTITTPDEGFLSTSTPSPNQQVHLSPPPGSPKNTSSVLIQTELVCSEMNTQTDETLQTYEELSILLASWHKRLLESKGNEEALKSTCQEYEERCQQFQTALTKYHKQFKVLQKVATKCRKESKKREEGYKKEIADMKAHHKEVLQKLTEKLDILV